MTLLEKYGRFRVTRVVQEFYEDLLRDARLAGFFEDVSISGLVEHQGTFLSTVMGGPLSYTANDIMEAHSKLSIGAEDFDRMIGLLAARLEKNGFEPEDIEPIISTYRGYQVFVTASRA